MKDNFKKVINNDFDEEVDKNITQYFQDETRNINIPNDAFLKVKSEILNKNERGFLNMKFGFLRVKTVLASLICLATIGTVGVAASNGLSWGSSSSPSDKMSEFPSESKVKDGIGYLPKYVDAFSNGFKFESACFRKDDMMNSNWMTLSKTKGIDFFYSRNGIGRDNDHYLDLSISNREEKYREKPKESSYDEIVEYNGIKLYYKDFKFRTEHDGYKPTEEEQKQIDEGNLQISYGDEDCEITESNMHDITWEQDGIEYLLANENFDDLTEQQMIDMAKEVIDK